VEKFLYPFAECTYFRQISLHTAEPLVPETNIVEEEIPIRKLKRYKSSCIDPIPAELIKAVGEILYSELYKLLCFIWSKEKFHSNGRNLLCTNL
jgi:hypothetical protein